jgi:succinyl-diaminopimelate desuccinylase
MNTNDLKARIDELVKQSSDQILQDMKTILGFRTVSGSKDEAEDALWREETAKCLDWLATRAAEEGLEFRNYENEVAVIDFPGGDSFVGLPLHIDVVPPGEGWTHGPFDGHVTDDGVIYGRGTQDDKGPVIQMLHAVRILKKLGLPTKRGARLIIGTAEECGDWSDIKAYFKHEPSPEYSIVSDAGFPVINGEKGLLNFFVRLEYGADSEPTSDGWQLLSLWAGERANIVPPLAEVIFGGAPDSSPDPIVRELQAFLGRNPAARASIEASEGHLRIVFEGKPAHGSTPQEGHSAALDALLFLAESAFLTEDEADIAEFLFETGSDHTGAALNVAEIHPILGSTTLNLGKLRWSEGAVEITYNIRNTMGLTAFQASDRARAAVEEFCAETGFAFSAEPDGKMLDAIYRSPADYPELLGALKEAYEVTTGRTFKEGAIGGSTYAKVFPNSVCFGPVDTAGGDLELAHQTDERITVDALLRNVRIYAHALARLCIA